jgi:hypothetical protein
MDNTRMAKKTPSPSGKVRERPRGNCENLAYAEMGEMQPPSRRDVWCTNVDGVRFRSGNLVASRRNKLPVVEYKLRRRVLTEGEF